MSGDIYIQESWVNKTEDYSIGDSDVYKTYHDDVGKLFVCLQKEYGRCVSSVYVDTPEDKRKKIGWVFEKKEKYTDCNKYFTRETWVTLHEKSPEKTTRYFYKEL